MYAVAKEVARAGLSFCCLQEVKYRNIGSKLISLDTGEQFEFHWCGQKQRRDAGVGIMIKVHPGIEINTPDVLNPRVMAIDLKINGFNIRVVNGYSPTNCDGTEYQKETFYRLLRKASKKNQKHQKVIVAGDFNAETELATYKSCYDGDVLVHDNECNDNGSRVKSFSRSLKLCISSSFFDYPLIDRYTWYSNDKKTMKIIDYVLAERYIQQYITQCIVMREYDFDSDHRLLKTTLTTPCTRKARRTPKKIKRKHVPDIKSLHNSNIQQKYIATVNHKLRENIRPETPTDIAENIMQILHSTAEETLPQKSKTKTNRELWKDDIELNDLLKRRTQYDNKSLEYKITSKKIKKRVGQLRNEKLRIEAHEINDYASKRQVEELYRTIKADGSTFKCIRREEGCDPVKLKEHFKQHFNHTINIDDPIELTDAPAFIAKLQEVSIDIQTAAPNQQEVREVLMNLKHGKASNDIPVAYLKYAAQSEELIEEMVKLYSLVWDTHQIPKSWGHSKLVALWKGSAKGKIDDPTAHRALQIGSIFCKTLMIIIINRIKIWYENQLLDQQQGFRSGRGTADGIYITKRIQQITDQMKKPTFLLFVDLTAAFDHVVRKWMFKSIYQRFPQEADTKLIELLEAVYSYTTTSLAETPDEIFELTLGVRQGGPESPPLYNLFMDYVMRIFMDLCEERGIQFLRLNYRIRSTATTREERIKTSTVGIHDTDWVGYADDLNLVFEDSDNLQKGLQALHETFTRYNLAINVSKTKTMILNHQYIDMDSNIYPNSIVSLNNIPIENVTKFRYLGDEIKYNEPSTGDAEINLRIDVAENKFYELGKKLLNYNILLKTRVKVLNSMVRSRLTYSCQTWNVTTRQIERIKTSYSSMLRKMIKGGYRRKSNEWSFVLTNDDLHNICETETIEAYVSRQQQKYLAHIARQSNTTLTKRLLFNSEHSRKPGPKLTLESNVLRTLQCSADEFYKKAMDRRY